MILAAAIIGLVTAYYFGSRRGVYAAAASAVLFAVAFAYPAYTLYCYAIVAIGLTAIVAVGPKVERSPANHRAVKTVRQVGSQLGKVARRWWQSLE